MSFHCLIAHLFFFFFFFFCAEYYPIVWMYQFIYVYLFSHLLKDNLIASNVLANMSEAAINVYVFLCEDKFSDPLDKYQGTWCTYSVSMLPPTNCPPKLCHFAFSSAMNENSCCSISLLAGVLVFWILGIRRTDVGAETPTLLPPDAGKYWRQEEKGMTEDEMVGCYHQLDGHEFG